MVLSLLEAAGRFYGTTGKVSLEAHVLIGLYK